MYTMELYALESYQIWEDPAMIAIETTIEGSLGNTKIARKEKRLMAAAQAGDDQAINTIKKDIDEDLEKLRKAARAERNKKLALAALKVAGVAATITKMIIDHKREVATKDALKDILVKNNGQFPPEVQQLLAAQNKHGTAMTGANIVSQVTEPFAEALKVVL